MRFTKILSLLAFAALFAFAAPAVAQKPGSVPPEQAHDKSSNSGDAGEDANGENGEPANGENGESGKPAETPPAAAPEHARERAFAAKACRVERGESEATITAFRLRYGTNDNQRNAFGMCVSGAVRNGAPESAEEVRTLVAEIRERKSAARNCMQERSDLGAEAFRDKYGTNPNKRNAFGKCVSSETRDNASNGENGDANGNGQHSEAVRNAARACLQERGDIGVEAFRDKYGTNPNKRNAFGKCVSSEVRNGAENEDPEDQNGGSEGDNGENGAEA